MNSKPEDCIIYANGIGGWFAWDCRLGKRLDLVFIDAFTEAVRAFEERIGPYYASRPPGKR